MLMGWHWLSLVPIPVLAWLWIELIRDEALPIPLPKETIRKMLQLAKVKKKDVVYDLGSGDGRALTIAGEFGAKAVGIEKNRLLVWLSKLKTKDSNVKIIHSDIFKEDISNANVVMIYLSHKLTQRLKTKFEKELKKGTRIVSASHPIEEWNPAGKIKTGHFYSYLYKI
jgi:SAM-dependent methyltransferase